MLGKNLPLSIVTQNPDIININFLGPLGNVHVDTIVLSATCMLGVLAVCACITPRLVAEGPGGPAQACLEGLYNFCEDLARGTIGHRYKAFFPLIAAIFIFVLTANFIGIAPWKALEHIPGWFHLKNGEALELASPTTDFNVTLGLAAISLFVYIGAGLWVHGWKYAKELVFNPIEWLDLLIRPSTLALRLMLVITADEITRLVCLVLLPQLVPVGVMGFEMFIALIQAFVFAILTAVYIGGAVAEHH